MDPIYKPLTKKEKENLSERGLKEWEYLGIPKWADPDSVECKFILIRSNWYWYSISLIFIR